MFQNGRRSFGSIWTISTRNWTEVATQRQRCDVDENLWKRIQLWSSQLLYKWLYYTSHSGLPQTTSCREFLLDHHSHYWMDSIIFFSYRFIHCRDIICPLLTWNFACSVAIADPTFRLIGIMHFKKKHFRMKCIKIHFMLTRIIWESFNEGIYSHIHSRYWSKR